MIGASPKPKDALRFLAGAGRYVDDLTRPGLVHLGVVRSAHAHARILRVNARAARAIRGVLAVWTAADLPQLAQHDGETGVLTVWASIQSPYSQRDVIARVLGLPAERVRVIVPDVGGAFGPKGQVYADEVLVAAAAYRLGRPVKWVEARREHLATVGHDREQLHEATVAFALDGTIAALEDSFLADVGAYPVMGNGLTANTVNHLPGPYRVPHYRAHGERVATTTMFNAT